MSENSSDATLPQSAITQIHSYRCCLCEQSGIKSEHVDDHKAMHGDARRYGLLIPQDITMAPFSNTVVPTYSSTVIAKALGVSHAYIRDEGANYSGSMKDYIVRQALAVGRAKGYSRFSIVSSGNHAVSLAMNTDQASETAILFTPSSSSKIPLLITFPHVVAVGMHDALIEDVYNLVAQMRLNGIYDINAHNEYLLPGLLPVASDILSLDPLPTHVLSGVGNGTYLAGIGWGFTVLLRECAVAPKIVAVGMKGAFPSEDAHALGEPIVEYDRFFEEERMIDAAEGSIAIESYSMPQLMDTLRTTNGFTLGKITNDDLAAAYELLATDSHLMARGAIPEPTGIMSLAAALKWKERFCPTDVIHCSFTGHGVKDLETIARILPFDLGASMLEIARRMRGNLLPIDPEPRGVGINIMKDTTAQQLNMLLRKNTSVLDPIES